VAKCVTPYYKMHNLREEFSQVQQTEVRCAEHFHHALTLHLPTFPSHAFHLATVPTFQGEVGFPFPASPRTSSPHVFFVHRRAERSGVECGVWSSAMLLKPSQL
jgi:hypothetical protein